MFERSNEVVGKDARLILETETTRAGPDVQRVLGGVLPHLVRNALDHGLEDSGDDRVQLDKPAEGSIIVRCRRDGDIVEVAVADDGGGIDPDRLAAKALEKGLYDQAALDAMDDQARIELVFHPGFSTADEVTSVSGRGVGMDAVQAAIQEAGGSVRLQSQLGSGTTLTMHLPAE